MTENKCLEHDILLLEIKRWQQIDTILIDSTVILIYHDHSDEQITLHHFIQSNSIKINNMH